MTVLPHRLIVITDTTASIRPLAAQVDLALRGGPFALVLRDKHLPWRERLELAAELRPLLHAAGGVLLVADPAGPLDPPADGAHLSSRFPVPESRPPILGRSVHAGEPIDPGLDYLTYSPVWPVESKSGYGPVLGPEGLAEAARTSPVPVYALGGVTGPDRARAAREAGAAGVAVQGAVMRASDPVRVVTRFRAALGVGPPDYP